MTVLLVMVITSLIIANILVKFLAWMAVIAVLLLQIVINVLKDGNLIVHSPIVLK